MTVKVTVDAILFALNPFNPSGLKPSLITEWE